MARTLGEDVQHKMNVVQQNPFRLVVAFHAVGALAGLGELLLHFIGDGLYLAWVGAGAEDKVISKSAARAVHLQNGYVFTFFAFNGLDRERNLLPDLETHPFL